MDRVAEAPVGQRFRIRSILRSAFGLGLGLALFAPVHAPAWAQARAPLAISIDSTAALSAIRAVDLRQICKCPNVVLDSIVRISATLAVHEIPAQPAANTISAGDAARLQLAGRRVSRTALRFMTRRGQDSIFVAVQLVPPLGPRRRVLMAATPPNGVTAGYLVTLEQHRGRWRVLGTRSVF